MPLLVDEAKKLSSDQLIAGVIEELIEVDDTFALLPFTPTSGKAYVYNRENVLATAQFILPNLNVPESATSFSEISVTLRILIGDVDVDNFLNDTLNDTNSQKAIQIAFKAKAIARKFSDTFINGDEDTAHNLSTLGGAADATKVEFDGINVLCPAGQVVSNGASGGALSFDKLDELIDKVKLGPDALVMSRRSIRDYKKLLRAMSNVSPEYITLSNGRRALAYAGVPILRNDFISEAATVGSSTDCSTIYAARFNEGDGVHGIYGGQNAGFQIVEIGQLEGKDSTRTRVRWYCALALKATHALAKLVGVRAS